MTNYTVPRIDAIVARFGTAYKSKNSRTPVTYADDISTDVTVGGTDNDLASVLANFLSRINGALDHDDLIRILDDIDDIVEYTLFKGDYTDGVKNPSEIWKHEDRYYEVRNAFTSTAAPTVATSQPADSNSNWRLLTEIDNTLQWRTARFHDYLSGLGTHTDSGSIRNDLVQLAEVYRYRGVFAAGEAYVVNDEIESTDGHFYVRLIPETEGNNATAPTATTANWRKVVNGSLEADIIRFHKDTIIAGNAMPDLPSLPDAADYADGDIIFFEGGWQKRYSTHANAANQFTGTAGFQIRDGASFRGIAGPDRLNSYQQFGQFTANPDGAIGMLVASGSAMQVSIRADLFVAAKGSAFANTDSVFVRIVGNGAETVACAYDLTYHSGGHDWYFFDGRPGGARPLNSVSDGDEITFTLDSDSSGTPLLTHDVATGHWIAWTPDGTTKLREELYSEVSTLEAAIQDTSGPRKPTPPTHVGTVWGRVTADLLSQSQEVSLRSVISHDTRDNHGPYDYKFTYPRSFTSGHGVDNLNDWNEIFPTNPTDYDNTKPGFVRDGGDHQWNSNGIEFTNINDRRVRLTANIKTNNSNRRLGDTMELRFSSGGRVKLIPVDAASTANAITKHTFTFLSHQAGGENADHSFQFDAFFTGSPRSGVRDWFKMHLDFDFSDGAEYFTPELVVAVPESDHIPTQKYRSNGWHSDPITHLDLRPAGDYRLWTFDLPNHGQSSTLGDNQALALVSLDDTGGFLLASRDIRRAAINVRPYVAKNLSIGDGYIDIWTDVPGVVAPKRLKRVRLSSSEWSDDAGVTVVIEGLLTGQRVFVTTNDPINSASNQGGVEITWDANMLAGNPANTVIVPGLIDTFSVNIDASAASHTVGPVNTLPSLRQWQTVRLYHNGLISTFPWPWSVSTLPAQAGNTAGTHPAIGPVSLRTMSNQGSIAQPYWVQFYASGGNYHVNFRGSNGGQEPHAYVEKIEIDYRV